MFYLVRYSVATKFASCHACKPVVFQWCHFTIKVLYGEMFREEHIFFLELEWEQRIFVLADRKHISNQITAYTHSDTKCIIPPLIIYMKKFLNSAWLAKSSAIFFRNSYSPKKWNTVQIFVTRNVWVNITSDKNL